jgi:hypothetical protein
MSIKSNNCASATAALLLSGELVMESLLQLLSLHTGLLVVVREKEEKGQRRKDKEEKKEGGDVLVVVLDGGEKLSTRCGSGNYGSGSVT